MGLTILWAAVLFTLWTFAVGIYFYVKGYVNAASKAIGMVNSLLDPYLTDLMKDKTEGAREKFSSVYSKFSLFKSKLENISLREL